MYIKFVDGISSEQDVKNDNCCIKSCSGICRKYVVRYIVVIYHGEWR